MNPLQRLILDQMHKRGWSPKQVEARGVSHATLHRYMNPVKLQTLPRRQILEALAAALDLPLEAVRAAAMATIGWDGSRGVDAEPLADARRLKAVPTSGENPVIEAIKADPYLLPEAKEHFLNQYELLRRVERESSDGHLAHVAEGDRSSYDPKLEDQIDKAVRKGAKKNPDSPFRDRDK